jgi:polyhydroxyalkanoate synthesis regulator phasin
MKAADLFYLGLGGAYMAKDRLENLLNDMEQRGQISKGEAQKFIEDAKERAHKQQEDLEQSIKARVKEAVNEYGLASKDDIQDLKDHISKEFAELKKLLQSS